MNNTLSLEQRIVLLFTASAAVVALLAGLLFCRASEAYFVQLDRQRLEGKLALFADQLKDAQSSEDLAARHPQLEQELRRHPELALRIEGGDGQLWFTSQPELAKLPISKLPIWHWASSDIDYQVMDKHLASGSRISLLLDISHRQHFLLQMQQLIWLCVGLSALATASLGAWVARRGLRPLRDMTAVTQQICASSLTSRLPQEQIPAELAELAAAFNAMLGRLEDAFARLSAFSADIAHELRTPLANLLTQTQVILSQPRAIEDYREALHSNLEELQHLAQMVGDMLLLAKAEHGLLQTRRETLALDHELTALAEYFAPLAEEAGVRLEVEGQAPLDADRGLLRRALSNLIDNALRFTPHGGELRLVASAEDSLSRVVVANQGPTIPAELRERLFDRFYRADSARREGNTEHAGLGLAITRSIVQTHGGSIRCESAQGYTRFILEFPAQPPADGANPACA